VSLFLPLLRKDLLLTADGRPGGFAAGPESQQLQEKVWKEITTVLKETAPETASIVEGKP